MSQTECFLSSFSLSLLFLLLLFFSRAVAGDRPASSHRSLRRHIRSGGQRWPLAISPASGAVCFRSVSSFLTVQTLPSTATQSRRRLNSSVLIRASCESPALFGYGPSLLLPLPLLLPPLPLPPHRPPLPSHHRILHRPRLKSQLRRRRPQLHPRPRAWNRGRFGARGSPIASWQPHASCCSSSVSSSTGAGGGAKLKRNCTDCRRTVAF